MMNRMLACSLSLLAIACAPEALTDYPVGDGDMATDMLVTPDLSGPVVYTDEFKQVAGILRTNCATIPSCHGSTAFSVPKIMGDGMATEAQVEAALKGVKSAAGKLLIAPPDAAGSHLVARITGSAGGSVMPLGSPPLSAADIAVITTWIEGGAIYSTAAPASQDMGAVEDMVAVEDMAAADMAAD
jgi:hypothetical protein